MRSHRNVILFIFLMGALTFSSCLDPATENQTVDSTPSIVGTWKLLSGTIIKGNDTTITDYTQGQEMIKIINETHFAFMRHDLSAGKDSSSVFAAGGGTYTVTGNVYTEHLDFFTIREWEGHHFELTYSIDGDTLITKGIEEVGALNIRYFNMEKYVRISK